MTHIQTIAARLALLAGWLLLPTANASNASLVINDTLPNGVVNLTWSGDLFTSFVVDSNPQALTGSLNLTD